MRSKLLVAKLGFLWRVVMSDLGSLSTRVLETLCDDAKSVCLVRECRKLEESFGTRYADSVMRGGEAPTPHPYTSKYLDPKIWTPGIHVLRSIWTPSTLKYLDPFHV